MLKKPESTHCGMCGKDWSEVKKFPKRALCVECHEVVMKEYYAKKREEYATQHRYDIYSEFAYYRRKKHYHKLSVELNGIHDRAEWQELIRRRFDEIQQNKLLWEYITREIIMHKPKKPKYEYLNLEDYD